MTTDALYVTFRGDAEWFRHSSEVLEKNLAGYRNMVVVAPEQDRQIFDPIAARRKNCRMVYVPDWPGAGYFWQQWQKIQADLLTDADFIAHIDSDVFIKSPVAVVDFFVAEKPAILWAYYTDVSDAGIWKGPTERATMLECTREFMQAMPPFYRRDTYAITRDHIQQATGRTCEQYIREAAERGSAAFSEFNAIGRIAWERQHTHYHWVDRNREPWPPGYHHSQQFWSHAPLANHLPAIRQMIDGGTEQQIMTTNRGIWVLTNDSHISRWVEQQNRLDFDQPFMRKICRYIKKGDVVVDVGAFIGDHTWAYANATRGKAGGRVLAFEPNPLPFDCLTRNMAAQGHVDCINRGLSDVPGFMGIALDPNVGASHLVPGAGIEVTTLDSYSLARCALIKVDAEGLELRILRGAVQTIDRCRPVIVMEINHGALARQGTRADEIYAWLRERRYRIEGVVDGLQFDIFALPR